MSDCNGMYIYIQCVCVDAWLQDNCRVCGGRLGKFKVSYDCHTVENQSKLQSIRVSVEQDKKTVHPSRFCHACYNKCIRTIKASEIGKDYNPMLTKFHWVEHTTVECTVCTHFSGENKGRRPKKTSSTGRPSNQLLTLISHLKERSPPSTITDLKLRERISHQPSIDEDLKCPLCKLVLDRPLLLTTCSKLVLCQISLRPFMSRL